MRETVPYGFEHAECPRCNEKKQCVVCHGKDYLHGVPGYFTVVECENCKFWYLSPRPKSEHLANMYPINYAPHANPVPVLNNNRSFLRKYLRRIKRRIYSQDPYMARALAYEGNSSCILNPLNLLFKWQTGVSMIPKFVNNGKLLEIGCASGSRLLKLKSLGWNDLNGVELVSAAAKYASELGFNISCGQIENEIKKFDDNLFDTIIISMVIEHLQNPFETLNKIRRKLKPGGELLLSTVVRDSIDGKFFKEFWAGFDFPRHLVFFKKTDLDMMLSKHFSNITYYYQNAPIDFVRSASWRKKGLLDKIIEKTANTCFTKPIMLLLAFLGKTTRVSIRCS